MAAWVGATIVSIFIASAAVGSVRGHVSDTPQPMASVTTPPPTTATTAATTASAEPLPTTVTTVPTTTVPTTTVTTVPDSVVAAPSTTTPPIAVAAAGEIKTYTVAGGTVSIEVFADHLTLLGAVPAPGFSVAEKEISSRKIEIEFKSGEQESKFAASLEDGRLEIETESHDEE